MSSTTSVMFCLKVVQEVLGALYPELDKKRSFESCLSTCFYPENKQPISKRALLINKPYFTI